jgi:hypothetical protein
MNYVCKNCGAFVFRDRPTVCEACDGSLCDFYDRDFCDKCIEDICREETEI